MDFGAGHAKIQSMNDIIEHASENHVEELFLKANQPSAISCSPPSGSEPLP